MKICTRCGNEKPLSEFYKQSRNADGYEKRCKQCKRDYAKGRYDRETPEQRERRHAREKEYRKTYVNVNEAANKAYIQHYLQHHECVDCGEDDWVVLEFDHVRDQKEYAVSALIRFPIDKLIKEIGKCDVRCANCHRRVTYARAGNWRIVGEAG